MVVRKRIAVHGDCDDPVAAVERQLRRESGGPPVDGPPDDLAGSRLHAGAFEHVDEPHTRPAGIAHQIATDVVGDARDRHVVLDQIHSQKVVVREPQLVVDHAVHAKVP